MVVLMTLTLVVMPMATLTTHCRPRRRYEHFLVAAREIEVHVEDRAGNGRQLERCGQGRIWKMEQQEQELTG
jgi:hypothetical protein